LALITFQCTKINAQDTTRSLAFKENHPFYRITLFYPTTIYNDLWNIFNLTKAANSGEAPAQHELGIRYLTGQGVIADTSKALYWIKKAADQKLPSACYNYAIMLINSVGVKWDPVEAFKNFLFAAQNNMPEAEYAVGIFYTDDLVIERNWDAAYLWVKKAADAGSKAAKDVLPEIAKRANKSVVTDTTVTVASIEGMVQTKETKAQHPAQNSGLMFLDFTRDTTAEVTDENIWDEFAKFARTQKPADTLLVKDSLGEVNGKLFKLIEEYAKNGSPEALTLLARFYEKGIYVEKDDITAMVNYFLALRLDDPFAPHLLWKLATKRDHTRELKARVDRNNSEAKFIWAGLWEIGLDYHITSSDAFRLLQQAAQAKYAPAASEIALCYYNGTLVSQNKKKAVEFWALASELGSDDARVRIVMNKIRNSEESDLDQADVFEYLTKLEKLGSVTAQITLAYCYERGIGTLTDKAKSTKLFRSAAQRGSRFAYQELKRIYDEYKR